MERGIEVLLTVVICTHRRPQSLSLTLESLARFSSPADDWEVLVVENDVMPAAAVRQVVDEYKGRLPLRSCLEKVLNLSSARNRGSREALGGFLAYVDDDAEVTAGWLDSLRDACSRIRPDFCGGPSYPLFREKKPLWYKEVYATEYVYGTAPRELKYGEWLGGMNFTVRKDLLLALGGFREGLGMAGNTLAYGEETNLMMEAWKMNGNLKVVYLPEVHVLHEVRSEKFRLTWHYRSWWANGRDSAQMKMVFQKKATVLRVLTTNVAQLSIKGIIVLLLIAGSIGGSNGSRWRQYVIEHMKSNVFWISYELHSLFSWFS